MRLNLARAAAVAFMLCAPAQAPAQDRGLSHPANLSSAMVQDMLNAALDACHKDKPSGVGDDPRPLRSGARLVPATRNASPHTLDFSQRKAYTGADLPHGRRPISPSARCPIPAAHRSASRCHRALGGGLPIKAGDDVVGAIGVSGSQGGAVVGSNDVMCVLRRRSIKLQDRFEAGFADEPQRIAPRTRSRRAVR